MADEEIRPEVYYIPENFEDTGGVLGGHLTTRNAIEMGVLCAPLAFVEYQLFFNIFHTGLQLSVIVMMFTIVPVAALAAFGIGGESLSQLLIAYIRFLSKRRKLSYVEFTDKMVMYNSNLMTLNGILDSISADGFKGTLLNIKKYREAVKAGTLEEAPDDDLEDEEIEDEQEDTAPESTSANHKSSDQQEKPRKRSREKKIREKKVKEKKIKPSNPKPIKPDKPIKGSVKKNKTVAEAPVKHKKATTRKTESVWMKSAMREVLLQKLELGDDEDDDLY